MKNKIMLSIASLFLAYFAMAQVDVRVQPSRLFFYKKEGKMQEQMIKIINKSNKAVVFKVEIMGWKRDGEGVKKYTKSIADVTNKNNWFYVDDNMVKLAPMQEKMVKVHLRQLNDTMSFANAMIFFSEVNMDTTKKGVIKLVQLGVHIYFLKDKNDKKHLEISKVDWKSKMKDSTLLVDIQNKTNAVIDSELNAEIVNANGEVIAKTKKSMISSMPGDAFCVPLAFTQMPTQKGDKILVYVDNGMEHPLQVVEVSIQ